MFLLFLQGVDVESTDDVVILDDDVDDDDDVQVCCYSNTYIYMIVSVL